MGETNSESKPSGLLARIQAMQSEKSQTTTSSENETDSLTQQIPEENSLSNLDIESFNYSEDTNNFSDDDFNLGDFTLNQDSSDSFKDEPLPDFDDFTIETNTESDTSSETSEADLNSSLPEASVFGLDETFDIPQDFDSSTSQSDDLDLDFDSFPTNEPTPQTDIFDTDTSFENTNIFDIETEPLESENFATDDLFPRENTFDSQDFPSEPNIFDIEETSSEQEDFDIPSPMAESGGLSFTGLYDKETILGDSAGQEEIKKKTKVPVLICIICAIICLIATTLVLFIIPSKYNILGKTTKIDDNTVIIESTEYKPSDKTNIDDEYKKLSEQANVPPAKTNEIVVIEKAEDVIPIPPAVNPKTTKNETYKIKWGDTLWDISNTYYKTPWKYKYIASYNKIANPDHIISGTTITIPAE